MASNIGVNILIQAKDQASQAFQKISGEMGKTSKSMSQKAQEAGRAFAIMGAVTTGALAMSAKTAIEFESAFAGVVKTYEAVSGSAEDTERELGEINKRFKDMTRVVPVAFTELSQIGELAGQLGVRGVDNMEKFVDTVAKISVATNLTSEAAATDFARIANVMQEPLKNVDRMGATIVDLGNNFATTERDISEFAQRIAGAGKIAGLTTADVFAIGTAMSSVGVQAEAGGTAVQKALISIQKAVVESNESLAVFADTAGMTSEEFQKAWSDDAGKAFTAFVTGLGDQGDNAINTLADLGLEDQRLLRSFLSLANAGDLLNRTIETSSQAWEENTALSAEAEKRFSTTASQMKLLRNNVALVANTLGEKLLPIINQVITAFLPYAEKLANFIEQHPKLSIAILGIVSVIGILAGALIVLAPIITGITSAIGILNTVIGAISVPVLIVIAIIGALIAIGVLLWKNWDTIKAKAGELWAFLVESFNNIKESTINFVTEMIEWFKLLPQRILQFAKNMVINYILSWAKLVGFMYVAVPALLNFIFNWFKQLPEKIPMWIEMMREKAEKIWQDMTIWILKTTLDLMLRLFDFFSKLPKRIADYFEETSFKVTEKWNNLAETVVNGAKSMVQGAVDYFKELPSRVLNAIGDLARKVRDKIVGAFKSGEEEGKKFKLKVEGFQYGGVVPAPLGKPQLAVVHGGETVVPTHTDQGSYAGVKSTTAGGGGGDGLHIHLHTNLFTGSRTELRNVAEMLVREIQTVANSQNKTPSELLNSYT